MQRTDFSLSTKLLRRLKLASARLTGSPDRPRVLANSFPKAGTHLLTSLLTALPGYSNCWRVITPARIRVLAEPHPLEAEHLTRQPLSHPECTNLPRLLARCRGGQFVRAHLRYSDELLALLRRQNYRVLFIIRDPRDVAVSHMHYILKRPQARLYRYFSEVLTDNEAQLMTVIRGAPSKYVADNQGRGSLDIGTRLDAYIPRMRVPEVQTTRFEKLVGSRGGGTDQVQQTEIKRIADFLDAPLSASQTADVAGRVFSPRSLTFRKGQIGGWRATFTQAHREAFKEVAGQQLIALGYENDLNW